MSTKRNGFTYIYTKEKAKTYQKLSAEQKLEWIEKMSRFLYLFMPKKSKLISQKLKESKR